MTHQPQAITRLTRELIRSQNPVIVRALAEAATRLDDIALSRELLAVLTPLTDPDCRDAVCAVWADTRHPILGLWLAETGWIAAAPEKLRWLTALKTSRLELFDNAGPEIIEPLLRCCANMDATIAQNARLAFTRLQNPSTQAEFFRRVLETDSSLLRELALTIPYTPRDPQQRALFYLLTEQWEKYESLDFDRSLLRAAYQVGGAGLQRRITDLTRRAGRADFIEVLAGGRQQRRLAEMSGGEWAVVLALLVKEQQWAEAWRLAQAAPAIWSAQLLSQIPEMQPNFSENPGFLSRAEQAGFDQLQQLAARCQPAGLLPGRAAACQAILTGHTGAVHDLAISPDGHLLVSGSEDQSLRLWRLPGGESLKTLSGHSGEIWGVAMSADGRLLVSGSDDNSLRLWRLPDGLPLENWQVTGAVNALALSPDERLVATGTINHTIRLLALPKGQPVKTLTGHTDLIIRLAFSPDGRWLVSASRDQTVRLWRLPEGTLHHTLGGHTASVNGLAISPDSLLLASGGLDKTIRLWRLADGQWLETLTGHTDAVVGLAINPTPLPGGTGGWLLASASLDQTVRLWRIPEGKLLHPLEGHSDWVTRLAFSPAGHWLASASYDQTLRLWATPLARLCYSPATQLTLDDLDWAEAQLNQKGLPELEQAWLEFLIALQRWRRRYDIEVETAHLLVGEFDIELEG